MSHTIPPSLLAYMQAHINETQAPLVVSVLTVVLIIAYVAVGLRFLSRWKTRSKIWWDDYLIIVGLIIVTGSNITMSHAVVYGFGRHIIAVSNPQAMIQSEIAVQVLYTCSLPPIKISILCLYRRIFPSDRLKKISIAVGGFVIAYSVVLMVCMIIQCLPIDSFWTGAPATCINFAAVLMVCSILNVVTDCVILAMPIPFIWNLKVQRSKRFQLIVTFALGGVVTGISIARTTLVAIPSTPDKSWSDVGAAVISMVEIGIAVLSACLPTYRPLFHSRVSQRPMGSSQYYKGASHLSGSKHSRHGDTVNTVRKSRLADLERSRESWVPLDDVESKPPTQMNDRPSTGALPPAPGPRQSRVPEMRPGIDAQQVVVTTDWWVNYDHRS